MATVLEKLEIWLNNKQFKDAVKKFGSKKLCYKPLKDAFLKVIYE